MHLRKWQTEKLHKVWISAAKVWLGSVLDDNRVPLEQQRWPIAADGKALMCRNDRITSGTRTRRTAPTSHNASWEPLRKPETTAMGKGHKQRRRAEKRDNALEPTHRFSPELCYDTIMIHIGTYRKTLGLYCHVKVDQKA